MSGYIIPAMAGFLFKFYVIYIMFDKKCTYSNLFLMLLVAFMFHNITEILLFLQFTYNSASDVIMRCYYVACLGALAGIGLYAISVSQIKASRYIGYVFAIGLSVLLVITITTNWIIAGTEKLSYGLTAIKGNYYWMFQFAALGTIAFATTILILGYRKAKDNMRAIQCGYSLVALTPLFFAVPIIIVLMALGFKVNALLVLPITTTLFLYIILKGESAHDLTDIRRYIPFSLEHETVGQLHDALLKYNIEQQDHGQTMEALEKVLISYKLKKSNQNISQTAVSMNVPRSTLYSMMRRLRINSQN